MADEAILERCAEIRKQTLGINTAFATRHLTMKHALIGPQIFTLDIDGRPTLVFEANGSAEACEICLDADLRSDLNALTSGGIPICPEDATLSSRPAVQEEIAAFKHAVKLAPASDEPTMAFLVKVDGVIVVAVDPQ